MKCGSSQLPICQQQETLREKVNYLVNKQAYQLEGVRTQMLQVYVHLPAVVAVTAAASTTPTRQVILSVIR